MRRELALYLVDYAYPTPARLLALGGGEYAVALLKDDGEQSIRWVCWSFDDLAVWRAKSARCEKSSQSVTQDTGRGAPPRARSTGSPGSGLPVGRLELEASRLLNI